MIITDPAPDLRRLYDLTITLFSDEERITRALEWVDQVLPVFTNACRRELSQEPRGVIDLWLEWLTSDSAQSIAEAGKGAIYEWRRDWLITLLTVTKRLERDRPGLGLEPEFADELSYVHKDRLASFPPAFWHDLIDYLAGNEMTPQRSAEGISRSAAFPIVLSEPVIDGGSEINVILARFLFEKAAHASSSVFMHPEEAAVRCIDARFAGAFAHAGRVARMHLGVDEGVLPDVRVRIRTIKPGHERFLGGTILCGDSGGGALAAGLYHFYTGQPAPGDDLVMSFAVGGPGGGEPDGKCYPVGGADDKVRGCARLGMKRLIVAKAQQSLLALYGHQHGVEIIGVENFSDAVRLATPRPANSRADCAPAVPYRIVLLCHPRSEDDLSVAKLLKHRLADSGHQMFLDCDLPVGIAAAKEIEQQIHAADIVIPLVSATSALSDMLASELQTVHEAPKRPGGYPRLLAVRVKCAGALPDRIAHILEAHPQAVWRGPGDDEDVIAATLRILESKEYPSGPVSFDSAAPPPDVGTGQDTLEPFDGLVPLNSRFYIERDTDKPFLLAIAERHGIILIKGPRQMGKSSLLARGLHQAEEAGARVAVTDFQKLTTDDFRSLRSFYCALARMLARQLGVAASLDQMWTEGRGANLNFEEFVEDHILPQSSSLIWAMDEVDRLFYSADFNSDVFGLFRSWANERQGRPRSPWARITLAIAYATEAHLFIKDVNQSPFNVGTRFELRDFTIEQVAELNGRYGYPLPSEPDLLRFFELVGGHPYLVRRGLHAMVTSRLDIAAFEAAASRDEGPIGDHLHRILILLARNEENCQALRGVLRGHSCPSYDVFHHLRSAGLLTGSSIHDARIRCKLYETYLKRHLF